ncbi:MAG: acyltransferase family protein [Opitutaceae bacterium]|nr:acyltransferase family protein [Opitutaceae bacterium]
MQNHSGFGPSVGGSLAPANYWMAAHLGFHVPFFFAAAFLFYPEAAGLVGWVKRVKRVIVPFLFWALMYTSLRLLKIRFLHSPAWTPLDDPIGWAYSGASVHLYFVPMLITGMAVTWLLDWTRLIHSAWIAGVAGSVALVLFHWLASSGNSFELGTSSGFVSAWGNDQFWLLRCLGLLLAWAIRVLPYILFAACLRRSGVMNLSQTRHFGVLLVFLVTFLCEWLGCYLPPAPHEVFLGITFLLMGIAVSAWIPAVGWIQDIGRWTFGIYLSHQVFMQIAQQIGLRAGLISPSNQSLWSALALTVLAFAASVAFIAGVDHWAPNWTRRICGLK